MHWQSKRESAIRYLGTELNQLLPPYSLDQAESDFEIDVSYLYVFLNSSYVQLLLVEILGNRSPTNFLRHFWMYFEGGDRSNCSCNWRYWLLAYPDFCSWCWTFTVDDVGALSPHSFKNSSFSIPTQCGYCKVFFNNNIVECFLQLIFLLVVDMGLKQARRNV